jgi:hypothetical protein
MQQRRQLTAKAKSGRGRFAFAALPERSGNGALRASLKSMTRRAAAALAILELQHPIRNLQNIAIASSGKRRVFFSRRIGLG